MSRRCKRTLLDMILQGIFKEEYEELLQEEYDAMEKHIEIELRIKKQRQLNNDFYEYKQRLKEYAEHGLDEKHLCRLKFQLKAMCRGLCYSLIEQFSNNECIPIRKEPFPLSYMENGQDLSAEEYIMKDVSIKDICILPLLWKHSSLWSINEEIQKNGFHYDSKNHDVIFFEEIGMGYVSCGNHSIAVGIIMADGVLEEIKVKKMNKIFEHIRTSERGGSYIRDDGVSIDIEDLRLAYIYELARTIYFIEKSEKVSK